MTEFQIPILTPIQTIIFSELSHGKSLTRGDLVKKCDSKRTTIYDNLVKLQKKKLVLKFVKRAEDNERPIWGRPIVYWYIPKYIPKSIRENILQKNRWELNG